MELRNSPKEGRVCRANFAFSLVEMLLALLVVSIILTAMAPVITKRHNDTLRVSTGSSSKNSAFLVYDAENGIKYPKGNALNSLSQTSAGEILFTNKEGIPVELKLTLQGAGGGGGGYQRTGDLSINSSASDTANQSVNSTIDKTWDFRIPRGVSNVRVTLQGGGGSGGLGAAGSEEYLLPSARNGNEGDLCIKKYNIGDLPSLLPAGANMASYRDLSSYPEGQRGGIPLGTTIVASVASGATSGSASNTCWYAKNQKTASTCTDATGYSGCYRTVCTQDVAINACAALEPAGSWRLPDDAEIKRWRVTETSNSAYQSMGVVTSNASDFCDYYSSSYGAAQCQGLAYGCQGSNYSTCEPSIFWSSVSQGNYYLNGGNLSGPGSGVTSLAFSARCVRRTSDCGLSLFAGAGGTSGAALVDVSFKGLAYGDRLLFTLGKGGSGGSGGDTTVEHQRWNGLAWVKVSGSTTYTAKGGSAGGSASTTAHGIKSTVVPNCLSDDNTYSTGCTLGKAGDDWSTNTSNSGGSSYYGVGGTSSNSSSPNGVNSANFGAAGSGGYGNVSGGTGGAGYALIKMNIASTGSGGGAGGYYSNVRVSVPANDTVKFIIGKGGTGGANGANGSGGESLDTKVMKGTNVLFTAKGGGVGKFTPIVSNAVSTLAAGGSGGAIYKEAVDVSDPQNLIEASGASAAYTTGGNGGISKSDNREGALGGCVQVNNPLSFSDCISNRIPTSSLAPLYEASKGLGKGGGGGAGAGCDDNGCTKGTDGANGFVTISW